jgi:hypothetical protein
VKVWDTLPFLGSNPDESVEDPEGLTGHGTGAPTIVTAYENTTHPFGPCGISYWNPDTNVFVDYGKTGGFQTAVDLNRGGPVEAGGPFGSSFGPGDTWMGGQMSEPLYMHIAGTNNFRTYIVAQTWGVEVDETTGDVFFTEPSSGNIARLDPTTNLVTRWSVGGNPANVTLDSAGRPYATLSSLQQIARVNPGTDGVLGTADDTVTRWSVPGPASFITVPGPFQTPDGITIDTNGNIWFDESNSNEIGRLSGGPDGTLGTADDQICEYTKTGLSNPQLIASTGSGGFLQAYFTEGSGNSVSVLTQVEADNAANPGRVCATVAPVTAAVTVTTFTPTIFDEVVPPRTFTITPTTFDVPGLNGFASGTTKTAGPDGIPGNADDECIPAIVRFSPMPGGGANPFPSGMTGVYAPNRIAGAYLFASKHFEVKSRSIVAPPPGNDPPTITCPSTTTAECTSPAGATVTLTAHVEDPNGDALTVTWNVDGGPPEEVDTVLAEGPPTSEDVTFTHTYSLGTHTVTVTVSDGELETSCTTTVTIVDTIAPTVSCSVATSSLWPPNHNLVNVGFTLSVTDACDSNPTVSIQVFADEDDEEPTGDGNHSPDAKNIGSNTLRLRSERKGDADGRVYLIIATVTDASGNVGRCCRTVVVPHSQSPAAIASVNAQAAAAAAHCAQFGTPPPGFVPVGDGPVIGPKQ